MSALSKQQLFYYWIPYYLTSKERAIQALSNGIFVSDIPAKMGLQFLFNEVHLIRKTTLMTPEL